MSFMLVEDFVHLPTGRSLRGRRGANGQFWSTTRPVSGTAGFIVDEQDGHRVMRCGAGSGTAHIGLAASVPADGPSTLFFRFRRSSRGGIPAVGLAATDAAPHPTAPRFTARPGRWHSVWITYDGAGGRRVYVQPDGEARRELAAVRAPSAAIREVVVAAPADGELLVTDVHVDPAGENVSDPRAARPVVLRPGKVVIVAGAGGTAAEASLFLAECLGRAFGGAEVRVETVRSTSAGVVNLHVGNTGHAGITEKVAGAVAALGVEACVIYADGSQDVVLAGDDEKGDPFFLNPRAPGGLLMTPTFSAVSRFLESHLGVRWYWPDLQAETLRVPRTRMVRLSRYLQTVEAPSFAIRDLPVPTLSRALVNANDLDSPENSDYRKSTVVGRWYRMNRLGTLNRIWGQHYWWALMPKSAYAIKSGDGLVLDPATEHYFAMSDTGVRGWGEEISPTVTYVLDNQICTEGLEEQTVTEGDDAPPRVEDEMWKRMAVQLGDTPCVSIAPNDGGHHCLCTRCEAVDKESPKAPNGKPNTGRRMFEFFNRMAERAREAMGDGAWVSTYAYDSYALHPTLQVDTPESMKLSRTCLHSQLVVFDTHNGYAFTPYDQCPDPARNTLAASDDQITRWARTNVPGGTGHVAAYTTLWWTSDAVDPYVRNSPATAGTIPIARFFAILACNRYMGAHFDVGLPGLGDRWLAARFFADAPPPSAADELADVITLYQERAAEWMDDYYTGLFGGEAETVRTSYDAVSKQACTWVEASTKDGALQDPAKLSDLLETWRPRTLYRELIAPCFPEQADGTPTSFVETVVQDSWQFARLTRDFLEAAEAVTLFTDNPYTAEQIADCRQLVESWEARLALAAECTDPGKDEIDNPAWNLVVGDGFPAEEVKKWPLLLEKVTVYQDTTYAVKLDVPKALNVSAAVVAVSEAMASLVGEGQPVVRLRERPESNGAASLWASAQAGDTALWTAQFSRVPGVAASSEDARSFIVVINDTGGVLEPSLVLEHLDPAFPDWKLYKCVRQGTGFETREVTRTLRPDVPTGTETVEFEAETGVNVLYVQGANFAPVTAPTENLYFLESRTADTPVTRLKLQGTWEQVRGWTIRTAYCDDTPIQGSEWPAGAFTVTDEGGATIAKCDATWGAFSKVPYNQFAEAYVADLGKTTITTDTGTTTTEPPVPPGTYNVYASITDRDAATTDIIGADGTRLFLKLIVEPS